VADVPVGIFLSGGVDSSILTFACRRFVKDQIRTLSIDFESQEYSEKYFQDLVVAKTGVSHKCFLVTQEEFEDHLPDIFKAMDQPSIDGINTYFISRYAKEYGLKVVLSGLGADELFGGYNSFNNALYNRLKKVRIAARIAATFLGSYPARKLQFIKQSDVLEEYLFNRGLFVPSDVSNLLGIPKRKVWDVICQNEYNGWQHLEQGNKASMLEQNIYMQGQLLRDSDIYSMWHSIELRVPFLDMDLIRLLHSIAPSVKFRMKQQKKILIDSFLDELPKEVWNREKKGFAFPFEQWFQESSYLKQAENSFPSLAGAKNLFDKGAINWTRYWGRVVSAEYQKTASSATH
jgi:asparagine synthase (glutamine-hydrolysing)